MRMINDQDVVRLLRSQVDQAGGQSSWARRECIDRTLLNRVLNGRRPPSEQIIRALRLCNVYVAGGDAAAGIMTIQVCPQDCELAMAALSAGRGPDAGRNRPTAATPRQ